jgi:biopolymer transport protein ExbB
MANSTIEFLSKGGPIMVPIAALSVMTLTCALERTWFWWHTLQGERRLVDQILQASQDDLDQARTIAQSAQRLPIGRFVLAALRLHQPTPETFQLAMVAAGDREFIEMRKCDKLLETVVAIAPLLGLLGTVTGLIATFFNLNIGGVSGGAGGGGNVDLSKASLGIAEALITTAGGMIVAIMALLIFRVCVGLQAAQMDYFSEVGSELELIYRQRWYEPRMAQEQQQNLSQDLLQQMVTLLTDRLPQSGGTIDRSSLAPIAHLPTENQDGQ